MAASLRDTLSRLLARRYKTLFGTAKVYSTTWGPSRIRVLDVEGTYQSATYLDDRWCEPPFPYLGLYACVFEAERPPKSICMLGGGGFAFPKYVVANHPGARIDVVEIDPTVVRIAREHFFLDRLERTYHTAHNRRLRIFTQEAHEYLLSCADKRIRYDAILNDCYAASAPDATLMTPAAIAVVKSCLSPRGMYLANTITALVGDEAALLNKMIAALSTQFAHVLAIPCDRVEADEKDNVVVVASDRDPHIEGAIRLYTAL